MMEPTTRVIMNAEQVARAVEPPPKKEPKPNPTLDELRGKHDMLYNRAMRYDRQLNKLMHQVIKKEAQLNRAKKQLWKARHQVDRMEGKR